MCKVNGTVMNRKFGVELEGYLNEDLRDGGWYVNGVHFDIRSDGSLDDNTDEEHVDCDTCDGSGRINEECTNCNGTGYVTLYDDEDNEYECECKGCDGDGERETGECEDCDGRGYTYKEVGTFGTEIVSDPITDTRHVQDVYRRMHNYDWSVDDYAGLHIHVDAGDYEDIDFKKLLFLMTQVEPVIYSITDSYRYDGGDYSLPMNEHYIQERIIDNLKYDWGHRFTDDRYYGLNYCAYDKHETIEFRYFAAQSNSTNVCKYIELVTQLVDFAKHATMPQIQVISHKLYRSDFNTACEVLNDILELSYDLKGMKYNSIHGRYNKFDIFKPLGIVADEQGFLHVQSEMEAV
jgi:hypothetical protein